MTSFLADGNVLVALTVVEHVHHRHVEAGTIVLLGLLWNDVLRVDDNLDGSRPGRD